jgi:multidrug transporter EmrE-like cation transporter
MIAHLYILLTILFTVYGQIIIKWQVNSAGAFPLDTTEKILFLLRLLLNPWVISSFICAFLAALSWMAAMTKFSLSYAYPFISLTFVLVIALSSIFFKDVITIPKAVGMGLIIAGIVIGSQG